MSLFDSSLHHNLHHASKQEIITTSQPSFMIHSLDVMPEKAVTVVSNHDTQPLQALEAPVDPLVQANSLCFDSACAMKAIPAFFIRIFMG